jgi:hypothetical protein
MVLPSLAQRQCYCDPFIAWEDAKVRCEGGVIGLQQWQVESSHFMYEFVMVQMK